MGRTLPTAVQLIQSEKDSWKHFRRSLRAEDQEAFDDLWRYCRRHAAPICMGSRPVPHDAMMMAMLVGLCRRIRELEQQLEARDHEPQKQQTANHRRLDL